MRPANEQVVIRDESLEPDRVLEGNGTVLEDQFELFERENVVAELVPAYYLLR